MNLYSWAGREKSCKKDSRYLLLCTKGEASSCRNLANILQKKEEARDPDPAVAAPQDFWSVMGDYIYRNHVAPRTKLYVPKHDFPRPVNYVDFQRQTKTGIDVLHEATIDDCWNIHLMETSRCLMPVPV